MRIPGRLHRRCSRVTAGKTPCGWFGCRRSQAARQRLLRPRPSLETTHGPREHPDAKIRCAIIALRHAFVMRLDAALPPKSCVSSVTGIFIPGFFRVRVANCRAVVRTGLRTIIIAVFSTITRAAIVSVPTETRRRIKRGRPLGRRRS